MANPNDQRGGSGNMNPDRDPQRKGAEHGQQHQSGSGARQQGEQQKENRGGQGGVGDRDRDAGHKGGQR